MSFLHQAPSSTSARGIYLSQNLPDDIYIDHRITATTQKFNALHAQVNQFLETEKSSSDSDAKLNVYGYNSKHSPLGMWYLQRGPSKRASSWNSAIFVRNVYANYADTEKKWTLLEENNSTTYINTNRRSLSTPISNKNSENERKLTWSIGNKLARNQSLRMVKLLKTNTNLSNKHTETL